MSAILNTHAQYYTYDMGKFLRFAKNILPQTLKDLQNVLEVQKAFRKCGTLYYTYITQKSLEVLDNKAEQDCAAQAY